MPELNSGQKAKKANDDFHEAVQDVMLDEKLDVVLKVTYASAAEIVFRQMKTASDLIKAHYNVED